MQVTELVLTELEDAYVRLKKRDRRWQAKWHEIRVLVNPNGPLINGGSDGDNGQTGRKLVMDYYGPRVPIGGGALSGKDLSHIERAAAYAAGQAALTAVVTGALTCKVVLSYAPNLDEPLDVIYEMEGGGKLDRQLHPDHERRKGQDIDRRHGAR
jgi:S-adenosylmethionine synthetase